MNKTLFEEDFSVEFDQLLYCFMHATFYLLARGYNTTNDITFEDKKQLYKFTAIVLVVTIAYEINKQIEY